MLIRVPPRLPCVRHTPPLLRLPFSIAIRHYANVDRKNPTRKYKFTALDEEMKRLHIWIDNLALSSIPKDLCKVTFSRSSGPGGQNVNKYIPICGGLLIQIKHKGDHSIECL